MYIVQNFRPGALSEPQRKVHLNEELVAQTMSQLYISRPRTNIARRLLLLRILGKFILNFFFRNVGCDVAETINLNSLEDLEDKFSHQAAITK